MSKGCFIAIIDSQLVSPCGYHSLYIGSRKSDSLNGCTFWIATQEICWKKCQGTCSWPPFFQREAVCRWVCWKCSL